MNKKIFFGVAGIGIIAGVVAGIVHRSNKKCREAVFALWEATDTLEEAKNMLEDTLEFLEFHPYYTENLTEEEDEDCDV